MTSAARVGDNERRVLILAPTRKDAVITEALLSSAAVSSAICSTVADLVRSIE